MRREIALHWPLALSLFAACCVDLNQPARALLFFVACAAGFAVWLIRAKNDIDRFESEIE